MNNFLLNIFSFSFYKFYLKALTFLGFICFFSTSLLSQDFSSSKRTACDSLITTFTYQDTGSYVASTWLWNFGNGITKNTAGPHLINYKNNGIYTVKLFLNGTDSIIKKEYIVISKKPKADFLYSDSLILGSYMIRFTCDSPKVNIPFTYNWDFGDGQIETDSSNSIDHLYTNAGEYPVVLMMSDSIGCKDTFSLQIKVLDECIIPNFFSPNNDGLNDYLVIRSNGYTSFSFEVYSSRGNLVFEKTAPVIIWDGKTSLGTNLQPGVYFYTLIANSNDNPAYQKKGFIHLYK